MLALSRVWRIQREPHWQYWGLRERIRMRGGYEEPLTERSWEARLPAEDRVREGRLLLSF